MEWWWGQGANLWLTTAVFSENRDIYIEPCHLNNTVSYTAKLAHPLLCNNYQGVFIWGKKDHCFVLWVWNIKWITFYDNYESGCFHFHCKAGWQNRRDKFKPADDLGTYLLCLTAATRSGPENMENKLSPLAEDVSSLELAESPWLADQLLFTASLRTQPEEVLALSLVYYKLLTLTYPFCVL